MQQAIPAIAIFLFAAYAILILYYRLGWNRVPLRKKPATAPVTTITVIIPARNEAANIGALIQSLGAQDYPAHLFDILVMDDHSTDDTAAIAQKSGLPNVRVLSLQTLLGGEKLNAYKKKAIETGIAHSTGELIVTTDADCMVPSGWLKMIAGYYETNRPNLLAMPVAFTSNGSFLEIFQALDFMTLQGITAAAANLHLHRMCNGANLAYTRKAFHAVRGFEGIDRVASGDDMLLMQKIYQLDPDKVHFLQSQQVIVHTKPMPTWKQFFNQRIRWASKSGHYNDKSIMPVLLLVYSFNCCLLLLPLFSIFSNFTVSLFTFEFSLFTFAVLLLAGKTMVELIFLYPVARFFRQISLLTWFPIAQPFHILYTVVAGWLGKFGKYQWKGRTVN